MKLAGSPTERKPTSRRDRDRPHGAVILLYHRVADLDFDPQLLAVSPRHFEEHLEALTRNHQPMALSELTQRLERNDVPNNAVAVTFDDGYADNLEIAKPLLEKVGVPATVFVTTAYLDAGREFWWDELENLLLQAGTLPGSLTLNLAGAHQSFFLEDVSSYSDQNRQRNVQWNVMAKDDPTARHTLYRDIFEPLKKQTHEKRRALLNSLWEASDRTFRVRDTHKVLSADQVVRLREGGLIDIGAHTVTHPVLSTLSPAAQREEISNSRTRLQELLNQPVASFSYPFGTRHDYTPQTVELVRKAGFSCACSNVSGRVSTGCHLLQYPRVLVRDWDGKMLLRRLDEVLHRA